MSPEQREYCEAMSAEECVRPTERRGGYRKFGGGGGGRENAALTSCPSLSLRAASSSGKSIAAISPGADGPADLIVRLSDSLAVDFVCAAAATPVSSTVPRTALFAFALMLMFISIVFVLSLGIHGEIKKVTIISVLDLEVGENLAQLFLRPEYAHLH